MVNTRLLVAGVAALVPFGAETLIAQEKTSSPETTIPLRDGWAIKSSVLVEQEGDVISSGKFAPADWRPTSVPSTVLNALVRNRVYPDLRFGLNSFLIPDSSDEFNRQHDLAKFSHLPDKRNPWSDPYWYRTEFNLPPLVAENRVWLHFNSINYRADVWLNGNKIADRGKMVGMFQRYDFDVTGFARPGRNHLAVKIFPVDHPGVPNAQLKPLGPERSFFKEIMKDVTMVMSIGYDCMPTVPDRNMGICQEVYLKITGPVAIRDPFVITDLPLPQTNRATLAASATLVNTSALRLKGTLRGTIVETGLQFQQNVVLGPGETRNVAFSPQPVMENPLLWWPVNYGDQNLYNLSLRFQIGDAISDQQSVPFGVREITRELYELDGSHGLRANINGKRIFCRGGYIQPEILFDWDAERFETEVRYFTAANLNLVYFEDIPNPPDEFLDACDKYGLLFGNCFYGCMWMKPGSGYPSDLDLLARGTVDIIKRYRNHPSLLLYMAMNEGDTRRDVYEMWRRNILTLDGTRLFIPSGYFPDSRKDVPEWFKKDLPTGMTDIGASYTWQQPSNYYRFVRNNRNWMFMIESGSASLPPIDSLRRFIPDLWERVEGTPYPLTQTWAHHGANHYYRDYDRALRSIHGEPRSVADYCLKGHLVTADQHRAMFEAVNHRMWDITSGFTQWKINACWPSVQWQIFDWFLKPMVSYYFIKKACEPLHIQLGLLEPSVTLVNNHLVPKTGLVVAARLFDFNMKLRWEKTADAEIPANAYKDIFTIPDIPDLTPLYFVKLDLKDAQGRSVSDNFYWLTSKDNGDLTDLAELPLVDLDVSWNVESKGQHVVLHTAVRNPTDKLAFFLHLAATKGPFGEEVLPVFWEDNYFSLLPGESKGVTATFAKEDLGDANPALEVGGWNVRGEYECTDLKTTETEVEPNEPFTVTAAISNTLIDGSRVELRVDGKVLDSELAWARAGKSQNVTFVLTLPKQGLHRIRVGDRTTSVSVK